MIATSIVIVISLATLSIFLMERKVSTPFCCTEGIGDIKIDRLRGVVATSAKNPVPEEGKGRLG